MKDLPLSNGIRSRFVDNHNGLTMHVLEAGYETPGRACVLLLHGFPELAYSWRKIMPALAAAGYYVVAPDQRGYGRTVDLPVSYQSDLDDYRFPNLVRDAVGLVAALGYQRVAAVVGHDFGSPVAAWCALIRPDMFPAVVLMSAPFAGAPRLPFDTTNAAGENRPSPAPMATALADLKRLDPPRKHYQCYYSTAGANEDMLEASKGLRAFLRGYYHVKSADWPDNRPFPLGGLSAAELAKLPEYYVMRSDRTMAETVADAILNVRPPDVCEWLTDEELEVYVDEYRRTGFQGGLQWYRCGVDSRFTAELQLWSGRTINVPALFIAGKNDWGYFQKPGDFEAMQATACTQLQAVHLVERAGHWVQQEQPEAVVRHLLDFLDGLGA